MYALIRFPAWLLPLVLLCSALIASQGPPSDDQEKEEFEYCSSLSKPGHSPHYEPMPDYSIERREYGATQPPVLLLRISTRTESFNGTQMVRLGCKLASDFPKEAGIEALIFDDKKAAKRLELGFTDQRDYGTYLWHLKARYSLDREKREHFVEFLVPEVKDELLSVRRFRVRLSLGN